MYICRNRAPNTQCYVLRTHEFDGYCIDHGLLVQIQRMYIWMCIPLIIESSMVFKSLSYRIQSSRLHAEGLPMHVLNLDQTADHAVLMGKPEQRQRRRWLWPVEIKWAQNGRRPVQAFVPT